MIRTYLNISVTVVFSYGFATDWLAQFVIRGTRKHLRQLFKEIIFEPLEIPSSEIDIWLSPELLTHKAQLHVHDKDSPFKFKEFPFEIYSAENGPEEGMAYIAEAGLNASLQAYTKILQAVVNKDPKIMSPATWELAFKDDFGSRGVKVTRPDLISMRAESMNEYVPILSSPKSVLSCTNTTEFGNLAEQIQKMVLE